MSNEAQLAALRAHVTQAATVACAERLRRHTGASHGIAGRAEAFWEMDTAGYVALHRAGTECA